MPGFPVVELLKRMIYFPETLLGILDSLYSSRSSCGTTARRGGAAATAAGTSAATASGAAGGCAHMSSPIRDSADTGLGWSRDNSWLSDGSAARDHCAGGSGVAAVVAAARWMDDGHPPPGPRGAQCTTGWWAFRECRNVPTHSIAMKTSPGVPKPVPAMRRITFAARSAAEKTESV